MTVKPSVFLSQYLVVASAMMILLPMAAFAEPTVNLLYSESTSEAKVKSVTPSLDGPFALELEYNNEAMVTLATMEDFGSSVNALSIPADSPMSVIEEKGVAGMIIGGNSVVKYVPASESSNDSITVLAGIECPLMAVSKDNDVYCYSKGTLTFIDSEATKTSKAESSSPYFTVAGLSDEDNALVELVISQDGQVILGWTSFGGTIYLVSMNRDLSKKNWYYQLQAGTYKPFATLSLAVDGDSLSVIGQGFDSRAFFYQADLVQQKVTKALQFNVYGKISFGSLGNESYMIRDDHSYLQVNTSFQPTAKAILESSTTSSLQRSIQLAPGVLGFVGTFGGKTSIPFVSTVSTAESQDSSVGAEDMIGISVGEASYPFVANNEAFLSSNPGSMPTVTLGISEDRGDAQKPKVVEVLLPKLFDMTGRVKPSDASTVKGTLTSNSSLKIDASVFQMNSLAGCKLESTELPKWLQVVDFEFFLVGAPTSKEVFSGKLNLVCFENFEATLPVDITFVPEDKTGKNVNSSSDSFLPREDGYAMQSC